MLILINETGSGEHVRFEQNRTVIVLKNGDNELPIEMRSALIDLIKIAVQSYDSSVIVFPQQGAIVEQRGQRKEVRIKRNSEMSQDIVLRITKNASRFEIIAKGSRFSATNLVSKANGELISLKLTAKDGTLSIDVTDKNKKAHWDSADPEATTGFEESYQGLELHAWTYCPSVIT